MKGRKTIKPEHIKQNADRYKYYSVNADFYRRQADEMERQGDKITAEAMRAAARGAERQAEEIKKKYPGRLEATATQPIRTGSRAKKPAKKKTAGQGKAFINALADSLRAGTLQHVTTEKELTAWIEYTKRLYTDENGLNKVEYCKGLNTVRDNLLFTVSELEKAIQDASREGNEKPIPGYKTMIEKYNNNAEILAEEIRKNGGKVNR